VPGAAAAARGHIQLRRRWQQPPTPLLATKTSVSAAAARARDLPRKWAQWQWGRCGRLARLVLEGMGGGGGGRRRCWLAVLCAGRAKRILGQIERAALHDSCRRPGLQLQSRALVQQAVGGDVGQTPTAWRPAMTTAGQHPEARTPAPRCLILCTAPTPCSCVLRPWPKSFAAAAQRARWRTRAGQGQGALSARRLCRTL
jgi:hypothetical protein